MLNNIYRKKRAYHSALNTPSYYTLYNNPNLFDKTYDVCYQNANSKSCDQHLFFAYVFRSLEYKIDDSFYNLFHFSVLLKRKDYTTLSCGYIWVFEVFFVI